MATVHENIDNRHILDQFFKKFPLQTNLVPYEEREADFFLDYLWMRGYKLSLTDTVNRSFV